MKDRIKIPEEIKKLLPEVSRTFNNYKLISMNMNKGLDVVLSNVKLTIESIKPPISAYLKKALENDYAEEIRNIKNAKKDQEKRIRAQLLKEMKQRRLEDKKTAAIKRDILKTLEEIKSIPGEYERIRAKVDNEFKKTFGEYARLPKCFLESKMVSLFKQEKREKNCG